MVCAPVRSIIPSLKLGDYLSAQTMLYLSIISFLYLNYMIIQTNYFLDYFECICATNNRGIAQYKLLRLQLSNRNNELDFMLISDIYVYLQGVSKKVALFEIGIIPLVIKESNQTFYGHCTMILFRCCCCYVPILLTTFPPNLSGTYP